MLIQNIEIIPVKPQNGLMGFASLVLNKSIFLGSIGIFKKKNGNGYRILYPTKKAGSEQLCIFHPTTQELSKAIESAINIKAIQVFEN